MKDRFMRGLVVLAIVIQLCFLFTSCFNAQVAPVVPIPDALMPIFGLQDKAGGTRCGANNRPYVVMPQSQLNSPMYALTVAHEMDHVQRLSHDCWKTMNRYVADSGFRATMEIQAHCAAVRFARQNPELYNAEAFRERVAEVVWETHHRKFNC